jgi:hypothetical protein
MCPSLIVANARIATQNPRAPWATALAIDGLTLAALGSSAEIHKLACPSTKIFDAEGQTILLPVGVSVGSAVHVTVLEGGAVVVDSVEDSV